MIDPVQVGPEARAGGGLSALELFLAGAIFGDMRVIICDLTGQLPRARRQDLERRLGALAGGAPSIDTVEVDLESADGAPVSPDKRARVTLRANHRRVVQVTEGAPTLADAVDQAMSGAAREREAFEETTGESPPLN